MKILHSYCLNYNIGDYALGIGLKNLMRDNLEIDLIGDTNIQGRTFDEYYINEVVNKRYDLLVIGGGGIIHGAHWPNGWFWLIEKQLIKTIKIPFVIYGVGYNYWEEEGGIPQRGIDHLKETLSYASHFSVRNDGSAERIKRDTGLEFPVVPDPGFHIGLNTEYPIIEKDPYVIVQLAYDKPLSRFGSQDKIDNFIDDMKGVVYNLSKDYKVIFAPHVYNDSILSKLISTGIKNTQVLEFGKYAFDHSDKLIGLYKHAKFTIAMRGHGQIVPIGFNTPVISLENHPKHVGLMQKLDLLDYNVKINQCNFKDDLLSKIEKLNQNYGEIVNKYKAINEKLELNSKQAFQLISDVI